MKVLTRALREIAHQPRFALLFVAMLGLGLTGFLLVESLRASVARSLEANSRNALSADLAVTLRRPFTPEEERQLEAALGGHAFQKSVELFSTVASAETPQSSQTGSSQLLLVKAVEGDYPFYGRLRTDQDDARPLGRRLDTATPTLAASPEVPESLGAGAGATLKLGNATFTVADIVRDDPTQSFRTFALGGRAYIHLRHLGATGLVQPGSTATWAWYVKTGTEAEAEALQAKLKKEFPGPEWRFTTAKEAGESGLRALSYLGDFLGLVSLVSLLLSSLGAAYLYRSYLEKRSLEIAIQRALGFPLEQLQLQAASQTMLLALLSLLPATALAVALLPTLEATILRWSTTPLDLAIHPESLLPLVALCLLGTPLLLLPELLVLGRFTPLALFREQDKESVRRPWFHYVPALLLFGALAPLTARSFRNSAIFLGMLAALVVLLWLVFLGFSRLLRARRGSWTTRHAFLLLARRKRAAAVVFLTLALGSLLLHLLPQLEASLRAELEAPTRLPSLFLFDIQQEQKDALEAKLAERGHKLTSISPLVRARITAVNDAAYERSEDSGSFRTREDEQEAQFRNRAVNLTFRPALQESETLLAGQPFPASAWDGTGIPAVSVETRYAGRIGVKIGDVLRFDVQGTEVLGRIVNERRVRWTSFQPNFFLVFQDGVLNDAPLTWLANLGAVPKEEKRAIQRELAKDFPNVSVIDVAATVERALDLLGRMRLALVLLAALALASGLSVMASVLSLEARERARSLVLYRALGAAESDLRAILLKESLAVCVTAVGFGALGSVAFTYGLSRFVFDGAFRVAGAPLLVFSLALVAVGLIVSWLATHSLVKRTPLEALRNSEY